MSNTIIESKVPERIEKVYQNLVLTPIEALILSHKQIQGQLAVWREHMKKFRCVVCFWRLGFRVGFV